VCRDPDPDVVGPTLARVDELLAAGEALLVGGSDDARAGIGLVMAAAVIAGTERLPQGDG
jgi:hypothetical protein